MLTNIHLLSPGTEVEYLNNVYKVLRAHAELDAYELKIYYTIKNALQTITVDEDQLEDL